jgi:predicted ATPase
LNQISNENLQLFVGQAGGADALLYFGQKTTDEIELRLDLKKMNYGMKLIPVAIDTLIFGDEEFRYGDMVSPRPLGIGHIESRLALPKGVSQSIGFDSLKSWRVYHFEDTSHSAKIKKTNDINDNLMLRPDASNLAAFLYFLREIHRSHYDSIVKTIRLVAPFFDDFNLQRSRLNFDKILLEWHEKGSDAYFNASTLSDGTLRFMCLATLLMQPDLPSTILIDEPELGLHPYAITLLAGMLRSAAARTQVIVSTQSVTLVNQFAPEDIIVVDREDDEDGRTQSVFKRLKQENLDDWLEEYSLGELWEKNVLGGRP